MNVMINSRPLRVLHQRTFSQRLGEILHFCLGSILSLRAFDPSEKEIQSLINKALAYHHEPLEDRVHLRDEASKILQNIQKANLWKDLQNLLENKFPIYRELEGYFGLEEKLLRPDLLAKGDREWLLLEFKLKEEQLNEEQLTLYCSFLKTIFPDHTIKVYAVIFQPPKLKFIKALSPTRDYHESPSLPRTTQLSLFK
ncbi:MAG: hypothetical protein RMI93_05155 [Caldimicrobium sp.]|nr:hypothetical protein [Caldimicrobium sp.]MDW8182973.1 hypothetical protein [Caldimicrobium sp.]